MDYIDHYCMVLSIGATLKDVGLYNPSKQDPALEIERLIEKKKKRNENASKRND